MAFLNAKDLDAATTQRDVLEAGYQRMPTKKGEVFGKEEEFVTHFLEQTDAGWREPLALLQTVKEYFRLDGWVSVRLKNDELVESTKERVEGKAVYAPEAGGSKYLKYSALLHGPDGKEQRGVEVYLPL